MSEINSSIQINGFFSEFMKSYSELEKTFNSIAKPFIENREAIESLMNSFVKSPIILDTLKSYDLIMQNLDAIIKSNSENYTVESINDLVDKLSIEIDNDNNFHETFKVDESQIDNSQRTAFKEKVSSLKESLPDRETRLEFIQWFNIILMIISIITAISLANKSNPDEIYLNTLQEINSKLDKVVQSEPGK